jgi:hypothetical protein
MAVGEERTTVGAAVVEVGIVVRVPACAAAPAGDVALVMEV